MGVGLVALANRVITFPEGFTLYQRMLPWGLALVFVGSGTIIAIILIFYLPNRLPPPLIFNGLMIGA